MALLDIVLINDPGAQCSAAETGTQGDRFWSQVSETC
jgi:hypothetical protein